MSCLPDVNVWLAGVWGRHTHHSAARRWFDGTDGPVVLCRITQMSLLRLLTIPAVLGEDALTRAQAWQVMDQLAADARVIWSEEPAETEAVWRTMSSRNEGSHKLWTDDYLAAFAQAGRHTLVTFDAELGRRHPSVRTTVLAQD
ncbi:TA system VapC family ribonuclease toxin [Nesterenkonia sp.]|uniref:TA system VapC family ribonuclease toxin n=1 Tax=Nesterenkonia sp. TaxID=704201 RepID=UPI00260AB9BC|nr:TA system VapC family ribonuclease toxin [Nesterenkonia sp.]